MLNPYNIKKYGFKIIDWSYNTKGKKKEYVEKYIKKIHGNP